MASSDQALGQDWRHWAHLIKGWGQALGFDRVGISHCELGRHPEHLARWLAAGHQGSMAWLGRNHDKRCDPAALVPGTLSIISVRLPYLLPQSRMIEVLEQPQLGYVSRYALGRDYHKLMRKRLAQLAERLQAAVGGQYRVFVDSAPVLEKAIAEQAGLGWIGKHSLLLSQEAGSWFFLGEIFTDLPLPAEAPVSEQCGACEACIQICPTRAILAPYQLDARRCISYLTIEHEGPIDLELRPLLGNRIYGCDDCQLVCPWNRYARIGTEADFLPRQGLEAPTLLELWRWDESDFLQRLNGSPIRRIGFVRWRRNLLVALGNAPADPAISAALTPSLGPDAPLWLEEHRHWALARQRAQINQPQSATPLQEKLLRAAAKILPPALR